jgi:hypothetical protein
MTTDNNTTGTGANTEVYMQNVTGGFGRGLTYCGDIPADCDICNFRQRDLDPYGCSKQENTTGAFGRFMVSIHGCGKFFPEKRL